MKVLNFGSLNIDYTYAVTHFVQAGETLSSQDMHVFSGGKGLNQSVALGRCGVPVYHAGAVGAADGDFLLQMLQEAGVNTEYVAHTKGQTGHAIIQKEPAGQNCILLYGGANQTVTPQQAQTVLAHFEAGDILVLQNEISANEAVLRAAHAKGMRTVLNPSPMDEKVLALPLELVDTFLLNEVEAAGLCGKIDDNGALLAALHTKFPHARIVLTLGGAGALCQEGETVYQQPIFPVKTVDTTAAGDTFTGYFVGSLVQGRPVAEAMKIAAAAAAIAVTRQGAAPSVPRHEEVTAFLQAHEGGKTTAGNSCKQ